MKSNHSNMPNTTNLPALTKESPKISLKNIAVLLVIYTFLVFGLNVNSYAIQQKMSIQKVLENVTQAVLEHSRFDIAMSEEDKQQLRMEMRQQWSNTGSSADNAQPQKAWKQMGSNDREQMRRDMVQTPVIELPATAAGPVNPAARR